MNSKRGGEPWDRWLTGGLEAGAVLFLMIPRLAAVGGLLALGPMSGAILSRLTVLGIANGDGVPRSSVLGGIFRVSSAVG
jgi:hypothetical protein